MAAPPPHAPVASPNAGALAPRHLACDPKGAQTQPQALWFVDAAGVEPRPRVVRTSAPVGHTPLWWPWGTRAQLSAIGARSRAGIRDCQGQDRALNSADVGAVLEHLRREVPGRLVSIWDGAPSPRRPLLPDCLAKGAAERVPVARRPAYAPALNPPEGVWAYLQGVERRKGCGVDLPPRRRDLGDAV
jgi:DDE superfamily endonuclease